MIYDALIAPFTEFEFMRRALAAVDVSESVCGVMSAWCARAVSPPMSTR